MSRGAKPSESQVESTATGLHDRYPGPRSFLDDPVEQRLFFGRDHETNSLVYQIRGSKLVVLFGKSGLGKTSLLQAGVFPRLRKGDLFPLRARLNLPGKKPLELVISAVEEACRDQAIDYTPGDPGSLWEFFKTALFWHDSALQTPVLVLDQFEEIFTRQDAEFRKSLARELGDLVGGGLPEAVRARRKKSETLPYSEKPPTVKIILSLREEYVGALEELFPEIPTILDNRVRLTALNRDNAREAIEKPAEPADAYFASRPFRFRDDTLTRLLDFLEGRNGEIEPFQLQVLCSHVERQVRERQPDKGAIEVGDSDLGTETEMEAVLQNFYLDAVRRLPSRRSRRKARHLCEHGLLSPEGHREGMGEGQIERFYKLSESDLETLENARLLRKEPGLGGFRYELTHDSLAAPVMKSRRPKLPKRFLYGGGAALILFALLALWFSEQARIAKWREEVAAPLIQVIEPEMVEVPTGSFMMGSSKGDQRAGPDEFPLHNVVISKPFAIGKYEVTFDEYDTFVLATERSLPDDEGWGRGKRPVINVSWENAVAYAEWLSQQTGKRYRLPSEAEWEYAARAGEETAYWWGDQIVKNQANCAGCGSSWDYKQTAPVGSFEANPFGLKDTAGNVWEWVQDCWNSRYNGAPVDGSAWKKGDCGRRVIRGGSWFGKPRYLRSAARNWYLADIRTYRIGFRLAKDL